MMSMPPGPPLVPSNDNTGGDALDPDRRPEEVDDDTAAAEALGYADPEDAPIHTGDDDDREDRTGDDASDAPSDDGHELREAELKKAEEAEHPQPSIRPEGNPYTGSP